jgi:pyruvate dehydrogenase complex dehydrogenase (E1) component
LQPAATGRCGNGKIIQELEGTFEVPWNVIKVVWVPVGPLFANDVKELMQRMNETVDGEYQNYKARAAHARASISSASRPNVEDGGEISRTPTSCG